MTLPLTGTLHDPWLPIESIEAEWAQIGLLDRLAPSHRGLSLGWAAWAPLDGGEVLPRLGQRVLRELKAIGVSFVLGPRSEGALKFPGPSPIKPCEA